MAGTGVRELWCQRETEKSIEVTAVYIYHKVKHVYGCRAEFRLVWCREGERQGCAMSPWLFNLIIDN